MERLGADTNPYRAGIFQIICVSESDAQAERDYAQHAMYLAKKLQHIPIRFTVTPGYMSPRSFLGFRKAWADNINRQDSWKELVDKGIIIGGGPATVRDKLVENARRWRAGHLIGVFQVGSMPHALARKNLEIFAREVLPTLRGVWAEYPDHWWPQALEGQGASAREEG